MISLSTHGLPCAARPTMTAAAPLVASTACARVRAAGDDALGRLRHHGGLGAEDLDRQRVLVPSDAEVAQGSLVPVLQPGAADHLRADQPGPVASALAPEGLDAHPGHGGEDEPT